MSMGRIIVGSLLCVAFSIEAMAQNFTPADPVMMAATDPCVKTISKARKKAQQICNRKIPGVNKKITKEEDKITKETSKLEKTIETNNRRRENSITSLHNSCQRKINSIYQKMASNALLKTKAQEAIINCVGAIFGGELNCTERNQATLLKLIENEAKLALQLESTEDQCDAKKQRIIDQTTDRNERASQRANDKIADCTTDIEGFLSDIDSLLADVAGFNNEITACGGQAVSCQ